MTGSFSRYLVVCFAAVMVVCLGGCGGGAGTLPQALKQMEQGKYAEAISTLESVVSKSPESATAWCCLGISCLENDQPEEAVKALRRGVELASGNAEAYEHLGRAYVAVGNLDAARETLITANQIEPDNPRILTALGAVEMKAGKTNQAYAYTMDALDKNPDYAPALYNIAVMYRDKIKNSKHARRFFRRFINAAPDDPRVSEAQEFLSPDDSARRESPATDLVRRAKIAMNESNYEGAIELLNDALVKDPGYDEAIWAMAYLYHMELHDPAKAVLYYDEFRKKFPNHKWSQQAETRSAQLKADIAKAERIREESSRMAELPVDPVQASDAEEALEVGVQWHERGNKARAEQFYRRALELDADMAEAHYNLGRLLYDAGKYDEAMTSFDAALESKGQYIDARYMLARAQDGLGDSAGAIESLSSVVRSEPDFAKAHYMLARVLAKEDHLEASRIHFDRFAQLTTGGAR